MQMEDQYPKLHNKSPLMWAFIVWLREKDLLGYEGKDFVVYVHRSNAFPFGAN